MYSKLIGKKVIIFGAGYICSRLLNESALSINFIVDNDINKSGYIGNIPVYTPDYIKKVDIEKYIIIIANHFQAEEIKNQLIGMGLNEGTHFIYYYEIIESQKAIDERNLLINGRKPFEALCFESTRECNSRCIMCDCWKRLAPKKINLDELRDIISDSNFRGIRTVNFSGGEPLLLPDIISYLELFNDKFPNIKYFSVNSNCLNVNKAIEQFTKINNYCINNNINFMVSISLDGIGEIHDKQRGIPGAFEKVIFCINEFNKRNIMTQVCSTITKGNIWNIDEVIALEEKMKAFAIIRVARDVKRFTDEKFNGGYSVQEKYQLKLLLYKLFLKGKEHQKIIAAMTLWVMEGRNRIDGFTCGYLTEDVAYITSTGNLVSCSKVYEDFGNVGNLKKETCSELRQLVAKKDLLARDTICSDCLEEFYTGWTPEMLKILEKHKCWRDFYSTSYYYSQLCNIDMLQEIKVDESKCDVLLISNFGFESVIDKMFLAEMLREFVSDDIYVKVASFYPFVTQQTLRELHMDGKNIEVIPIYNSNYLSLASAAEKVVFKADLLNNDNVLALGLWTFTLAKMAGNKTVLCNFEDKCNCIDSKVAKDLLEMTDEMQDLLISNYISSLDLSEYKEVNDENLLACFISEKPYSEDDCYDEKLKQDKVVAEKIKCISQKEGLVPYFYSLKNFALSGDDRDRNYRITMNFFENEEFYVEPQFATVRTIIKQIMSAHKTVTDNEKILELASLLDAECELITY